MLARAIAQKLSPVLNQPVIVDNRPGAGATLGATLVAKAAPDGHTLLMGAVHHTIATSVYKKLPYNFEKDFAPITTVAMVPNVLVVSASKPYKSVKDLIADAKASPGKLAYGSNGSGTTQHVIGTQFQMATGTSLLHVPYKGSAPLTTDMLGGQVDMSFDTITPVISFIKKGMLRPLAVTTAKRSSALPDAPTMQEAGVAGIDIGTWFGLLVPAATPKDITERLNKEIVSIINTPEFRKQMADIGAEPVGNTQAEMARQSQKEDGEYEMVSIGPTTSMRMEKFEKEFIEQTGVKLVVGKGGMGAETAAGCAENKAVHAIFPGGCAVLAATKVEKIEAAEWKDLGMPETLWVNRVREFGPLIISIDTKGNNLIDQNKARFNEKKKPILEKINAQVMFIS